MGKRKDLSGRVFGRLTVLSDRGLNADRKVVWECLCECRAVVEVSSANLLRGATRSCGCLARDLSAARGAARATHGHSRRTGRSGEYSSWMAMIGRCTRPCVSKYENYGGRGIAVCDRWMSFDAFLADMGPKPTRRHSIDRIDSNGNYEPGNCRWATPTEQSSNSRRNTYVVIDGVRMTATEAARRLGVSKTLVFGRVRHGWDIMRALTTPKSIRRAEHVSKEEAK